MARDGEGRANQRSRTRKDLLEAALRLSRDGRKPSLEEVAEEALVSRATAYRYFANVEALLIEAALHAAFPDPAQIFSGDGSKDAVERLHRADAAVAEMIRANEVALRILVANSIQQVLGGSDAPARQNRRLPLIEAALGPAMGDLDPEMLDKLKAGLSLAIGTEAMLVCKDVLRLGDGDAAEVRRWVIEALVSAARKRG